MNKNLYKTIKYEIEIFELRLKVLEYDIQPFRGEKVEEKRQKPLLPFGPFLV